MSYARAKQISADEIPVVDVAALMTHDPAAILAVGRRMREASETLGFFYVKNHGVSQDKIDRAFTASKAFFQAPFDKKNEVKVNEIHRGFIGIGGAKMVGEKKPDLKESFVWGLELSPNDPDALSGKSLMGPNQWPSFLPELQRDLYDYFLEALTCGRRLMKGLAASLDRPFDFFENAFAKPLARGGTIYYPPQPPDMGDNQFGVAPHTDYGGLTLLAQDEAGGLQVLSKSADWLTAHPLPGTLVINVGDLLGRWTNDRFNSNAHRVVNSTGRERQSIPIFFDPSYDTMIDPRDLLDDPGQAKYPPITCGDYIVERFSQVFKYRQK
jgi:isopenicillin N synthase-like dioxygenase